MIRKPSNSILPITIAALLLSPVAAMADVTTPHYLDRDTVYSKEAPNTSYFGTGISGRMNEASMLRFEAEQLLAERKFDEAVRKIAKALQLDPGDPSTHNIYAHALTGKLYKTKGPIDEQLLRECIAEWKLIWRHSTDFSEQIEARQQAKVLIKVARELDRVKEQKKELLAVKAKLAEKNKDGEPAKDTPAVKNTPEESALKDQGTKTEAPSAPAASKPAADVSK